MRKVSLIYLGVLAQKRFNMKEGFEIIEFPSDDVHQVRVVVPMSYSTAVGGGGPVEFDIIQLEKVGDRVYGEYAWVGYSSRANILAIQDV